MSFFRYTETLSLMVKCTSGVKMIFPSPLNQAVNERARGWPASPMHAGGLSGYKAKELY
jgi:hypothetical protein